MPAHRKEILIHEGNDTSRFVYCPECSCRMRIFLGPKARTWFRCKDPKCEFECTTEFALGYWKGVKDERTAIVVKGWDIDAKTDKKKKD